MAVPYRHYDPSLLEPVYPKRTRKLEDLAIELANQAGRLTQGLHPSVGSSLGDLVRSMNCYYSNLADRDWEQHMVGFSWVGSTGERISKSSRCRRSATSK